MITSSPFCTPVFLARTFLVMAMVCGTWRTTASAQHISPSAVKAQLNKIKSDAEDLDSLKKQIAEKKSALGQPPLPPPTPVPTLESLEEAARKSPVEFFKESQMVSREIAGQQVLLEDRSAKEEIRRLLPDASVKPGNEAAECMFRAGGEDIPVATGSTLGKLEELGIPLAEPKPHGQETRVRQFTSALQESFQKALAVIPGEEAPKLNEAMARYMQAETQATGMLPEKRTAQWEEAKQRALDLRYEVMPLLLDKITKTPIEDPQRAALEKTFEVAVQSINIELKSYDETRYIFPPSAFRRILNACKCTGAICDADYFVPERILGTGFLISRDLVLTARHVLKDTLFFEGGKGLSIHFDADDFATYDARKSCLSFRLLEPVFVSENDDLVVARIATEPTQDTPGEIRAGEEDVVCKQPPGQEETGGDDKSRKKEPCIHWLPKTERMPLFSGICALGYGGQGPLSIADFGRVMMPQVANESLLNKISILLWRESLVVSESNNKASIEDISSGIQALRKKLDAMYTPPTGIRTFTTQAKEDPSLRIPSFGARIDGRHGNSGGPVFDLQRGLLVGMYMAGAPDDINHVFSVDSYEVILPVSVILDAFTESKVPELVNLAENVSQPQ